MWNFGSALRIADCQDMAVGFGLSPLGTSTPHEPRDSNDKTMHHVYVHAYTPRANPCFAGRQRSLQKDLEGSELNFTARERTSALSDQLDAGNVFLSTLVIYAALLPNHGQVY